MLIKRIADCEKVDVMGCENRLPIMRQDTESSELVYERFNPGQNFPEWCHDEMEQIYFVLTGQAEADVGGEKFICGPCSLVYIPHYTRHAMLNTSDAVDMEYLCLDASPDKWASGENNWDEHLHDELNKIGKVDLLSLDRPERPYKYIPDVTRSEAKTFSHVSIIPALKREETLCTELLHVTVAADQSSGIHKHNEIEHIYLILSGTGTITVNSVTATVEPRAAIHIPRGAMHSAKADWAPLIYINFSIAPEGWPKGLTRWVDASKDYS